MKIKKHLIILSILLIILNLTLPKTFARYQAKKEGNIIVNIAKPIITMNVINDEALEKKSIKNIEIEVCNYNANQEVNNVKLNYCIQVKFSDLSYVDKYKLYKVENGSNTEILTNIIDINILETERKPLEINNKQQDKYILELYLNCNSSRELPLQISVESEQIDP